MQTLDELLKQKEANQSSNSIGVRMFIAQKEEIAKSISEQWKLLEIWQVLHDAGKMPATYRSFTNYVNRFITNPQKTEKEKGVTAKNNGVEDNTNLSARLEKPTSANTNISEATIAKQSSITTNSSINAEDTRKNKKFSSNDKPEEESLV
ncbi:MAG: hypothetical protein BWK73_10375 [Thiothrix lacustris]|uniref:Conjugal transfer protein TraK n=1 Tax=Thiothrix lacustris TaxID=525917 RepID=A0A1Y1QUG3_9GAMM|nr:MAG: hypothetical protein BWK73_10375 [Thiothrix lacustris]